MKIISQDYLPVRTFILIGVVLLTTTQTYAQNTNTRLSFTLKNATLKEFVKLIENSTGYSFIYGEEVGIRHKITLKAKEMPLHEVLDTVFKKSDSFVVTCRQYESVYRMNWTVRGRSLLREDCRI